MVAHRASLRVGRDTSGVYRPCSDRVNRERSVAFSFSLLAAAKVQRFLDLRARRQLRRQLLGVQRLLPDPAERLICGDHRNLDRPATDRNQVRELAFRASAVAVHVPGACAGIP